MKALGFDSSNPRGAFEALNKIMTIEDRIILTGKKGNVLVVAELEKLQQLKKALPFSVLITHTQAVAILYYAQTEEKYDQFIPRSLGKDQPNPAILSNALNQLSIKCVVDFADSKMLKVLALPEAHARIQKIWDECLHELDFNMNQNLILEIEQIAPSVTDKSIAEWFGHDNFVFLPGVAILVKNYLSLQKIKDLRSEWLEIDILYLKLLELFFKNSQSTYAKRISIYLKKQRIIPWNLTLNVRESNEDNGRRIFKILIPNKYREKILYHFSGFFREHSLEVTPEVVKVLHQQTGTKELKQGLAILQKKERVEKGFVIQKDHKDYIVFAENNDIDSFKYYWVRSPVSVSSLQKIAVRLHAKSIGCQDSDFKSCCNFLKIIADHPSNCFFNCLGVQNEIKIDTDNLRKLNYLLDEYVIIPFDVYKFIKHYIRDISDVSQAVDNNTRFVISKRIVDEIYRRSIPKSFVSSRTGNLMTYPCVVGDDKVCDFEELAEDEVHFSFAQLDEQIAKWKVDFDYAPKTEQRLENVAWNLSKSEAQYYFIKRGLSSVIQNLSGNNQGFMATRRTSTVFQPPIIEDSKEFKLISDSHHTPGTRLFTISDVSKDNSPVHSAGSSLLPSPRTSLPSSPDSSPGHYYRSFLTSGSTSSDVSSHKWHTIEL